jgi:hypothetical protein
MAFAGSPVARDLMRGKPRLATGHGLRFNIYRREKI